MTRHGRAAALAFSVVLCAAVLLQAQTPRLIVEAPPALRDVARRIEAIDESRLERALAGAGLAMPEQVRVVLVPEDDPRARATPAWIVGRAYGERNVELFPARIATYPYDSLESVVRHEVVHLALDARAGGRPLPRWFHEGVATAVESGWDVTTQLRLLLAAINGPAIADVDRLFHSDSQPATAHAYLLSAALVDDLRGRHGQTVPGAIAGRVADGLPFARAFEETTGETVDEAAARAWAGYRRLAHWLPVVTSPTAVWLGILALAVVAFVFQRRRRAAQRRRWDEEEASALEPDG